MPASASLNHDLLPDSALAEVAKLFDDAVAEHRTSGLTWAIIGGHESATPLLAHGAAGHRALAGGEPVPGTGEMDRETISRIASMTKSFTAATILALRDEGRLDLDTPISELVPEAAGLGTGTPDVPAITPRLLLTMSAGLITDNPWGDRQQAMSREEFDRQIRAGLGQVHLPGTGFEYSNTGFALLGRVIDEITGEDFGAEITRRFLQPLGMTSSGFALDQVDESRVAIGHRLADRTDATRFERVEFDDHGVYGAMAGIFSTVDDIAAWVRFLAAADAPDSARRDQSLLCTASRREMQQLHRLSPSAPLPAGEDGVSPGFDRIRGYGYGLVIEQFPDLGEIISHSGGYPGYGSFMAWHRESGVGIVALGNSKYAPAVPLSMQALRVLLRDAPQLMARRAKVALPRTLEAAGPALAWLRTGDDAVADAWFADNMDLDVPRDERTRRRDAVLQAAGLDVSALEKLSVEDATVLSAAHLRWDLEGADADGPAVRIDMLIDPRAEARIQALELSDPKDKRAARNF